MSDWFKKYNYELLEYNAKRACWDFYKVFDISPDQIYVNGWNKNKPSERLAFHFYDNYGVEIPKSLTIEQIFELVCSYFDRYKFKINPVRKLHGNFYIKLNKPKKIGKAKYYYLLQVKDKDPHYVWFNGCSGAQFGGKDYDCHGGYSTRMEAQQAIDKFHIDGTVYFYKGCGCCGTSYETLDNTVEWVSWFDFAKEKENHDENLKSFEKYIDICEKKLELGIAFSEYEGYGKSDEELLEEFKEDFEKWKKQMNCEHDFEFSEEDSKYSFFKCKKCGKSKWIAKENNKEI